MYSVRFVWFINWFGFLLFSGNMVILFDVLILRCIVFSVIGDLIDVIICLVIVVVVIWVFMFGRMIVNLFLLRCVVIVFLGRVFCMCLVIVLSNLLLVVWLCMLLIFLK